MTDIMLDLITNDIVVEDGDLKLLDSFEQLSGQAINIRLKANRGEWFEDISLGIPYLTNESNTIQLLGSKNKGLVDVFIKDEILRVDSVISILEYSSSVDQYNGSFKAVGKVDTTEGELSFSV